MPFLRGFRSLMVSAQANHKRHGRAWSQVCLATVAILRVPGCGRVFLHPWCGAAPDRHSAGVREAAVRPACSHPLHLLPYFLADPFRRAHFSGVASPPPLAPSPSVLVRLLVWPSNQLLWQRPVYVRWRPLVSAEKQEAASLSTSESVTLPPRGAQYQRRLEVVGFHGAQLAIDTTMVVRRPGLQCTRVDGATLMRARRRK